ncbi:MAG: ATP-binding protein [Blautia sp.]|nr:ATP-binding protein [Blautia sp.]
MGNKIPMGIQGFEGLRKDRYVYVDKTAYIYRLVHEGKPYFLSRPRRFGKSLLLSTMKAYWEGKKELFSGLAIQELEGNNPDAWKPYPVFLFDFNGANYQQMGALEEIIDEQLRRWETNYDVSANQGNLGERFRRLILEVNKKLDKRVVILVDEYDKPLLDVVDNSEIQKHNKGVIKGFFSTLKSFDEYIQFIFITGVSKFHKVSIFSDLNQLRDISMSEAYACLCGITEKETDDFFAEEVSAFAKRRRMTISECRASLRKHYDGYRFHPDGEPVFNPYSLLGALLEKEFGDYWFETGTPAFLVKKIRESQFDLRSFSDQSIFANEALLKDYTGDNLDPIPILYQTGYLTIIGYDMKRRRYTLGFPNEEVKYGFLESLIPSYIPMATAGHKMDIFTLDEYIENGELDKIKNLLTGLFANIPYTLESDPFEHYFQAVIYLVFTLLGKFVLCEMHTYTGRIDCKIETKDYIYLFEFKRDDTAEAALKQIESKDYALPFIADTRKLIKIGVSFDSATRKLVGWEVA